MTSNSEQFDFPIQRQLSYLTDQIGRFTKDLTELRFLMQEQIQSIREINEGFRQSREEIKERFREMREEFRNSREEMREIREEFLDI